MKNRLRDGDFQRKMAIFQDEVYKIKILCAIISFLCDDALSVISFLTITEPYTRVTIYESYDTPTTKATANLKTRIV